LTINGNATAPSAAKVFGIKDVVINKSTVNADTVIATLTDAAKVDVSKATITYGGSGTVEVTLPAAVSSPTFKVTSDGAVLKVGATTTTVNAHVTANNGYVEFAGAVTQATITGSGRVRFKNGSTATGFTTAASTITASVIDFPNGFTTSQYGPLTLSGDVLIPATKTITFGHEDGTLTLEEGTVVKTAAGVDPLLTAAGNVVITPVATAVLTVAAGGLDVSTAGVAFGGDVVFGGDLTLTAQPATFGGTAYFADTKKITLTAAESVITLTANTGALVAGAPGANPWVYDAVLQAGESNAVLTPGASVDLTFSAGGSRGIEQGATTAALVLSGDAHITSGATYTVAAGESAANILKVAAESLLTLGSGALEGQGSTFETAKASIVLTGHASHVGTLVLVTKTASGAAGGGGKLVLVGGGTALGSSGDIQPAQTVTAANLTATGPTDGGSAFTFAGSSENLSSITSISTSPQGFKSIEAATIDSGTSGTVTFVGGTSGTATLDKAATLQSGS
ncbi:MAG: hypothetical protein LBF83_01825, partial [Spirochaetaceae bacterium]|nr:hypothetical protein [Spirochaetaceae bacterium]